MQRNLAGNLDGEPEKGRAIACVRYVPSCVFTLDSFGRIVSCDADDKMGLLFDSFEQQDLQPSSEKPSEPIDLADQEHHVFESGIPPSGERMSGTELLSDTESECVTGDLLDALEVELVRLITESSDEHIEALMNELRYSASAEAAFQRLMHKPTGELLVRYLSRVYILTGEVGSALIAKSALGPTLTTVGAEAWHELHRKVLRGRSRITDVLRRRSQRSASLRIRLSHAA